MTETLPSVRMRLPHRADIQAMRGLAVFAYAGHHLTPWLPGAAGFMDMFFTLSGYLITLRLILLAERGGVWPYFLEFYRFRIKRLFPAALVTLALTVAVAYALFLRGRADGVAEDSWWAFGFLSNVWFARENVDYFSHMDAGSPVLAFWSLSVEEQFYLVWPVAVLVILTWAHRRGRVRSLLVPVSVLFAAASFAYGWWDTHAHPVTAYYSTLVRAWDFAIGAILASVALRRMRAGAAMRRTYATVLSWAGLIIFVGSQLVNPHNRGFPVPWAATAVLGASLVIYAGIDGQPRNIVLRNRVLVWLGDISYSVYLVLFPVLVFASAYLGSHIVFLDLFVLTATMAGSLLLFHFVEEPGRRGWRATAAWFRAGRHHRVVETVTTLTVVAVITFAVAPRPTPQEIVARPDPQTVISPSDAPSEPPSVAPSTFSDPHLVDPAPDLASAIRHALTLTSWPKLTNTRGVDRLGDHVTPGCEEAPSGLLSCVARPAEGTDPSKVALALGDSSMYAYWPMLRDAFVPQGWTVVVMAMPGCRVQLVAAHDDPRPDCRAYHASFDSLLSHWRPRLALLDSSEADVSDLEEAAPAMSDKRTYAVAAYRRGMDATFALAKSHGADVIVISAAPAVDGSHGPGQCAIRGSVPRDCEYMPSDAWLSVNRLAAKVSSAATVPYGDLLSLFCTGLRCPGQVDGVLVRSDPLHISPEYAALIAPSFADFLKKQRVL